MTGSRLDLAQASVSKHISVALVNDLSDLMLTTRRAGKILSWCCCIFLLVFSRVFWIRMAKGADINAQMTYGSAVGATLPARSRAVRWDDSQPLRVPFVTGPTHSF